MLHILLLVLSYFAILGEANFLLSSDLCINGTYSKVSKGQNFDIGVGDACLELKDKVIESLKPYGVDMTHNKDSKLLEMTSHQITLCDIFPNKELYPRTFPDILLWLQTFGAFTGSLAVMLAFYSNQKEKNGPFGKKWIATLLGQSVVILFTVSWSYVIYRDSFFEKGILGSIISLLRLIERYFFSFYSFTSYTAVHKIPADKWINHTSIAHTFVGVEVRSVMFEYAVLGTDGLPYFYDPNYQIGIL